MTDLTGYHNWHQSQAPKVMFIDSKDATALHDGTTHFTYVFRDTIQVKKNEGVLVSLLQASIPYSFYNVRAGINDKIDIKAATMTNTSCDVVGTFVDHVITLPPANYTAITLRNKFKELLENALLATMPSTITIDFDRDTQKFSFSIVGRDENVGAPANLGRIVIFNLSHGQNAGTHFDVELGFDSDTATTSVFFAHIPTENPAGVGGRVDLDNIKHPTEIAGTNADGTVMTKLTSDNIADLNGSIHSLYLRTNLPVISSMDSLTGGTSQIIAKIPIMSGPGSIIFHEPQNAIHKSLIQTKDIRFITIRLTDDRNRVISLNGLHFSLALMFEFVSLKWMTQPVDLRTNQRIDSLPLEKKNNNKKKIKNSKTLFPKNKISVEKKDNGQPDTTTYTHAGIPST
jgi:hypothetical protein